MKRTWVGEVCGGLSCGRDPTQGKNMMSPAAKEEGVAKTACDELIAAPSPCPLALLLEGCKIIRSGIEPRKKEGVGRSCFKIWGFFSLPYSDFECQYINFPQVGSVLHMTVIVEISLGPYLTL